MWSRVFFSLTEEDWIHSSSWHVEIMDVSRLFVLIFVATSECSGSVLRLTGTDQAFSSVPSGSDSGSELHCEVYDARQHYLLEGEAFHLQPDDLDEDISNQELQWFKNNIQSIPFDEKEPIYQQGGQIFFLNPHTQDSGLYIARHVHQDGTCENYTVKVEVFSASKRGASELLYGSGEGSGQYIQVHCPTPAMNACTRFRGTFTWYKNFTLLPGQHEDPLSFKNTGKQSEDIYTCICTWTHNHRAYNTSGSRWVYVYEQPNIHPVVIQSPTEEVQFADENSEIKLNCTVFCGKNVNHCKASWLIDGEPVNPGAGLNQTIKRVVENPSKDTITTATLTIDKVSAKYFQAEFKCTGEGVYSSKVKTIKLKRRVSRTYMVVAAVCVLSACMAAAMLVKCFAVDLALLFRPCLHLRSHSREAQLYDAYVVYQTPSRDKAMEDTLCQFLTRVLPSVLEEKCGYRLFIQGRDDMPGEDHVELVESSMKQSRRLMVILTPTSASASGSEPSDQHPNSQHKSVIGGFDWQVGLHHALVQREMSVILVQLGDTGPQGYKHLPRDLQHLIRKSAPLRWPQGSRDAAAHNSRFWKRVRYLMPPTPARGRPQAAGY